MKRVKKYIKFNYFFLLIIIFSLKVSNSLFGVYDSWNCPENGKWDDEKNWSAKNLPHQAGDVAKFSGLQKELTIDSNKDIALGFLQLDSAFLLSFAFSKNTLIFDAKNQNARILQSGSGISQIHTPVVLKSPLKIYSSNSKGSLIFSKAISGDQSIMYTSTGGFLVFQGQNSYTGETIINSPGLTLACPEGNAINGDLFINVQGSVQTNYDNQASKNSSLKIDGGLFNLNSTRQNLKSIVIKNNGKLIDLAVPSNGIIQIHSSSPAVLMEAGFLNIPRLEFEKDATISYKNPYHNGVASIGSQLEEVKINLNEKKLTFDISKDANDFYDVTLINTQFSKGSLIKESEGTLLFEGSLGNIPDLTINSGQVLIGRSEADILATAGIIEISPNGKLGGFGTIGTQDNKAILVNRGTLKPGSELHTGKLTVNGIYAQSLDGTLQIKVLDGNTTDQIVVNGKVYLSGMLLFESLPGASFKHGEEIIILNNPVSNIEGRFSQLITKLPARFNSELIYLNDKIIIKITEIPLKDAVDQLKSVPAPPSRLKITCINNKFLTKVDRIHKLKWKPSITSGIAEYRIYRDGELIGKVNENGPFSFDDHSRSKKKSYLYGVTAVDKEGKESLPLKLFYPKH